MTRLFWLHKHFLLDLPDVPALPFLVKLFSIYASTMLLYAQWSSCYHHGFPSFLNLAGQAKLRN
jgi:hypothetical protein